MRLTDPDLRFYNQEKIETEFNKLMKHAVFVNPLFITIRMRQNPGKHLPRLTLETACKNNTQFLNRLHRSLLGNNWERRHQRGLQRFVVVENSASTGIHTHMIIDALDIDINRFEKLAYEAYKKTSYFGQPFKHFNSGKLLDIVSAYSDGVLGYIAKPYGKEIFDYDMALDFENSHWMD